MHARCALVRFPSSDYTLAAVCIYPMSCIWLEPSPVSGCSRPAIHSISTTPCPSGCRLRMPLPRGSMRIMIGGSRSGAIPKHGLWQRVPRMLRSRRGRRWQSAPSSSRRRRSKQSELPKVLHHRLEPLAQRLMRRGLQQKKQDVLARALEYGFPRPFPVTAVCFRC